MLQKQVKELTEGMQSLCAIANKVVSSEGRVEAIERDLLLDALRHLYDIALQLEVRGNAASAKVAEPEVEDENEAMPDAEIISSTVMATMAAMGVAAEPVSEPEPKTEPVSMAGFETEGGLLFDEVGVEPAAQPANTLEEDYSSEQPAPVEPEPEPEPEPVEPEPEPEVMEPESEPEPEPEEPEPEPEPEPVEPEPEAVPEPEPAGEQSSLLDYLRHPVQEQPAMRTLGESLGGGASAETGFARPMARPVDDLPTVINDKFSFMSELFRNNMRAYNDFIMYLNTLASREEALEHVKQVAEQYKWDENSLAVKAFYKVFDMKF